MQSLYLDHSKLLNAVKLASAQVTLPEDATTWPVEITQELYKQVPYVSDFNPSVVMDKVDAEQGYGFGTIIVENRTELPTSATEKQRQQAGIRRLRIPIVIRARKLSPLDILVTEENKFVPLTEPRLRQNIFRAQSFDITSRSPGDSSIMGQLFPPYRQNYGMGGGIANAVGMGKMGSQEAKVTPPVPPLAARLEAVLGISPTHKKEEVKQKEASSMVPNSSLGDKLGPTIKKMIGQKKTASLLTAIMPTITKADQLKFAAALDSADLRYYYVQNATCKKIAEQILTLDTISSAKLAEWIPRNIQPDVLQISYVGGDKPYHVKTANCKCWAPQEYNINRGELLRNFGEKVAADVDTHGGVTITAKDGVSEEEVQVRSKPITEFGMYKVHTKDGRELVGYCFPNLIDLSGTKVPLCLFTNGSEAAFQSDIVGSSAGDGKNPPSTKPEANSYGVFFRTTAGGEVEATVPLLMKTKVSDPQMGTRFLVEDPDGVTSYISTSPHVKKVVCVEGTCLLPGEWLWLPLGKNQTVVINESVEEEKKQASTLDPQVTVDVRFDGVSTFSFSGEVVDKLASEQKNLIPLGDALFLLASLGTDLAYGSIKLGQAITAQAPVSVRVGQGLKLAEETFAESFKSAQQTLSVIGGIKQNLFKEAAFIPNPVAVDTILALGFINSENLSTFLSYLPDLEDTQSKLCELLVASRVGLEDIPVGSLERSVKSLETVIEGLKLLAFQEGARPT